MEPMVSVIIPTHNRAALLKKAINSVLAQTMQDFEIIVINDASNDHTQAMLHTFEQRDKRIKIIYNHLPQGGSRSRNQGIFASVGQYIAFLDDDDTWQNDKLRLQLQLLASHPKAVACSSAYIVNYPLKIKKLVKTPSHPTLIALLKNNILGGASVCLCAANVLKAIGGFDNTLKSAQDWDLWVRLRKRGDIVSVATPLVQYYVHFNYRISNDMRAKYYGSRAFYFKHKNLMTDDAKRSNLCFIAFIQSRQLNRSLSSRVRNLLVAIKHSSPRVAMSYLISSLPRMMLSPFSRK